MYYSAIGLLAVLVLIIVNLDILISPKAAFGKPVWNVYRKFLFAVLAYYLTDILWGVIESKKYAKLLFADTTVYFVAMSVGILFWAIYTVAYLDEKNSFGRFLIAASYIIAGLITVLTIVNIFVPVLFKVEEGCVYKALPARYIVLVLQILLLLLISLYALLCMYRLGGIKGMFHRYRILASFGFIMAALLCIQLWFPLLPLYSIGYMLGTCLLHTFIANDEKEEHLIEQEKNERIKELNDRFVSLLDNMPGMTFTKDAKTGVYLACNQGFADYAHMDSPDGVVGLTDAQIFDAETAAHFVEDDRTALSLSKPYVFYEDVLDAAGNPRQLQTTKIKYTDTQGRLCILGICQDVTDMVRIQHENAMTKEAYDKAVSSGLMFTHIAHTLARDYLDLYYINTDTEEYIEYGRNDESGSLSEIRRGWHFFSDCRNEIAENVYEEDRKAFLQAISRKVLMKALDQKDTFIMTYREISSSKYPVYVSMKISRMEDEKYIIMGITDVDAEMRETMARNEALKEALDSAELANRAKTTFLSGMSHEIRTPLNAIIGLDTLALKNKGLESETREYLEKIGESANRLLSIINDILDMSRIESGRVLLHKEEFSLGLMLDQINTMVMSQCNEKGLKYTCKIDEKAQGSYFGDDMKLKEMLLNILSNAIKFTEAPGRQQFQ